MTKRTTAALLAALFIISAALVSCGKSGEGAQPSESTAATDTQARSETSGETNEATDASDTADAGETAEGEKTKKVFVKKPAPAEIAAESMRIRAALADVIAVNYDAVGWIYVPGTDIDYCVVLGEDNDFYLDHSEYRDYYALGAIFEDYEDQRSVEKNRNTVLYGHNVWYGGMFHDVEKYLDEEYFNLKTPIYYYTMKEVYVFEPFTIFEADWGYQYFAIDFKDDEEYVSFLYEMRDNSKFPRDIEFDAGDRILTFSTCTNGAKTQRWCFQSYLTDVYTLPRWRPIFDKNVPLAGKFDMTMRAVEK